jgi:hypothetical protein
LSAPRVAGADWKRQEREILNVDILCSDESPSKIMKEAIGPWRNAESSLATSQHIENEMISFTAILSSSSLISGLLRFSQERLNANCK